MEEISVVIPTLGRDSLKEAEDSLRAQTHAITTFIIKNSPEDTLIKIKEALNESTTEFFAVADDDAIYPKEWISSLLKPMKDKVGFVGGPCLPMIDESSSTPEKVIAEVTSSFFGTTNMSYRWRKSNGVAKDADETNLVGNGLYRRELFAKIMNADFHKIPPAAWETYIFARIRQLGYRTVFAPEGFFYHKQRSNIFAFARQIFRCGMGRMNFFKLFPGELTFKLHMLFPMLFILYLLAFFGMAIIGYPVVTNIPLIAYVAIICLVSYIPKHSSRFEPFYFVAMHLSYGLGMLYGLVRNDRKWK